MPKVILKVKCNVRMHCAKCECAMCKVLMSNAIKNRGFGSTGVRGLGNDNWIIACMRGRCREGMHPPPLAPSTERSRCAVNVRLRRCMPLTLLSIHPIGFPLFMRAPSGVLNWDRAERCADWLLDKLQPRRRL